MRGLAAHPRRGGDKIAGAHAVAHCIAVGLTGIFASGKSTVADMMEQHGAAIVDADALGRLAVEPGSHALAEIARRFGPGYIGPDGRLDRARMAAAVFGDAAMRLQLDAIVHPRIRERSDRLRAMLEQSHRESGWPAFIVCNAALLLECDLAGEVDDIAVVRTSEAQCFRRARLRGGLTERQVVERLASQWSQRRKLQSADVVIDNRGGLDATRRQVDALCGRWAKGLRA